MAQPAAGTGPARHVVRSGELHTGDIAWAATVSGSDDAE